MSSRGLGAPADLQRRLSKEGADSRPPKNDSGPRQIRFYGNRQGRGQPLQTVLLVGVWATLLTLGETSAAQTGAAQPSASTPVASAPPSDVPPTSRVPAAPADQTDGEVSNAPPEPSAGNQEAAAESEVSSDVVAPERPEILPPAPMSPRPNNQAPSGDAPSGDAPSGDAPSGGGWPSTQPPQHAVPPQQDTPLLVVPPQPALNAGWAWVDTVPSSTDSDAEPPKRSAFRGSRFDWTHSATTTLLGVGADYQSSAYQVYRQGYTLLLNYFVYDGEKVRLRVATAPGMDVELTNSDWTSTRREPWFRDLPVALGLSAPLMRDDARLLSTFAGANLVVIAPTSKVSRAAGYYLTVSPRLSVTQQVPLRGSGATYFNDMELWLQVRYGHLFSRAATPVDRGLNIPRRTGGASAPGTLSDVLNGAQIAPNALRVEGSAAVQETLLGRPLVFTVSADYTAWMLAGVTFSPATASTEAVAADPDARTVRHMVGVGLDLTWQVVNAMSLSLGYGNTADLDNHPSTNPLYTPYAAFLAGVVLHVDTVLESLINRDKQRSPLTRRDLAFYPEGRGQVGADL